MMTLEDALNWQREQLKRMENAVRELKYSAELPQDHKLWNEAIAQTELAVRAIEEASMRLGKVLQYGVQGGVSKYDR
jgi:hypothetical protein